MKTLFLSFIILLAGNACIPAAMAAASDDSEVPALAQPLRQGDIITANDIIYIPAKSSRLGASAILDAADLIGKTPRRPLQAEHPLRTTDVAVPTIIHKGDIVSIVWKKGGITLTTRGRAMDNAGQNESLRLANTSTSRIIEARAVSSGEALIVTE
ncbi:MAG TPA: flagella basal body P-ring formation protein FlgA [Rhodospirillaceae bacterium]|nr:MAG: flagella basal body P-ring formation protein FlgA [Alphaproteobacteria bacterium GWF2_58_20]HAU29083.1 flagella basal body P-ring formation protein FlgA [Rhodospirillaceae bacterium]